MKYLLIIILLLPGCAALELFKPSTPGIEVNAQAGKTNEQEKNVAKVETGTTNQKADKISNDTTQKADVIKNITENIPFEVLLLIVGLAGLAIDGKGFILKAREDVGNIIKFPFNFILKALGRDKL